ncbi:MAG: type IV toxin-antitoxin system AbiEi family antitoxin domain-containing protein [Ignavibacteriaceae bacterium]
MEEIIKIFEKNKGYARMVELKKANIHTRRIANAVEQGVIEKIKPGLYKLANYDRDEHESFVEVCHANKRAVICMLSAASFYELTTFNPSYITVAVPHNTPRFKLDYPPIKVYYFADSYFSPGIEILKTKSGIVRIYNKEKTIGDLFRYMNKLGEDIAFEALKEYLRNRREMNIPKLLEYASICSVRKKIELLSKAILGGESI